MAQQWQEDILGEGFDRLTLPLGEDEHGEIVATLVRAPGPFLGGFARPLVDVDVLYVHGWSDYFFQKDLAHAVTALGARFFALDLRGYGRSLRDGEIPGYVTSLDTYDEDIAAALDVIGSGRRLVVLGHSTGGLTLSLWAARHPGRAAAVVLNSPWLELQVGPWAREALAPIVNIRARYDPLGRHPVVDEGFYTRAQRELGTLPVGPEREKWRPDNGFPTHPAWFAAILAGQETVARGIDVAVPAFVMLSSASTAPLRWDEAMTRTDSVLTVDAVAVAALRIGEMVTVARIDGAVHDVFLSAPAARDQAYAVLRRWLVGWAASDWTELP